MRSDVLGQAERLAADLWGADLCRFCGNGSTQGNQALALALGRPGRPRRRLQEHPQVGPRRPRPLRPRAGLGATRRRPGDRAAAGAAAGTRGAPRSPTRPTRAASSSSSRASSESSPTWRRSPISSTPRGVPLVVDQAWGAHLGFHPDLPPHTLAAGADAFVASSHKTLAAFTQSAYLVARGGLLDLERLDESFEILHTTSVSAAHPRQPRPGAHDPGDARPRSCLGETLRLAAHARLRLAEVDGLVVVDSDDPTKLALALPGTGADGLEVEADLFAQGIRFELANRDMLVPLLTIGDTEAGVERLCDALIASLERRRGEPRPPGAASAVWDVTPETALTPREAFFSPRETVRAEEPEAGSPPRWSPRTRPASPRSRPARSSRRQLVEALREAAAGGTRLSYCADPRSPRCRSSRARRRARMICYKVA